MLLVKHFTGKTAVHLSSASEELLAILQSHKYETDVIYSDTDPAVTASLNQHRRVRIENRVNEVETRINTVKERYRSVKAGLGILCS